MPYNAVVHRALIASPGDVQKEREVITDVIHEWNNLHSSERGIVILPVKWETHSSPELGDRPQAIINRDVVDACDLLIGVFWTRVGTPTGVAESGTIEEIERLAAEGKVVMLYFSRAKVELDSVDLEQYSKLKRFKERIRPRGLVESYETITEFRNKFANQLEIKTRRFANATPAQNGNPLSPADDQPQIYLHFVDYPSNEPLGPELNIETQLIECIDFDDIPDYGIDQRDSEAAEHEATTRYAIVPSTNTSYYREWVAYIQETQRVKHFRLGITNAGTRGVRDVYVELMIDNKEGLIWMHTETSSPPTPDYGFLVSRETYMYTGQPTTTLEEHDGVYTLKISFGAIQPQRTVYAKEVLYIGASAPMSIECDATLFEADTSPPLNPRLTVNVKPETVTLSYEEILSSTLEGYQRPS